MFTQPEVVYTKNTTNSLEKIKEIVDIIKTIDNDAMASILIQGISLSMKTAEQVAKVENKQQPEIDISEQIEFVCTALGFRLEDLVTHIVKTNFQQDGEMDSNKEVDAATMDFITGDLDDYEKFIAQTKAKESIDFLKQQL